MKSLIFRNQYVGIRHAESTANVAGFIASHIQTQKDVGLTLNGQDQIWKSSVLNKSILATMSLLVSSDFRRTKETAAIIQQVAQNMKLEYEESVCLRERYFGQFDQLSGDHYKRVWDMGSACQRYDVETADAVLARMMQLIESLERRFSGAVVGLVSHCDPLMILDAGLNGYSAQQFRDRHYFNNAEFRLLNQAAN